jgi:hypothetical protein
VLDTELDQVSPDEPVAELREGSNHGDAGLGASLGGLVEDNAPRPRVGDHVLGDERSGILR